ncbi:carboxylesterase [Sphingomonas sp. Leaf17]|uniref:carboxylesterase/lipase family protein n=1 Tax=Sphingomonas sp. Leaf17 TaxID=1735683 RepID=UPI0006FEC2CA|nr:carboxylesterase family protein [Sphingomonas sp. Leaf17]KQM67560.1 carboxylesterase [Sphingomonas sp. Leaf17]
MILAALLLATAGPVVVTDDGPVRGDSAGAGAVFRGIPYAAPPVGPSRWRAPRRPARWTAPRDTTGPHAACPQIAAGWNDTAAAASDENCLFLDVRTPRLTAGAKLPVMVWIHGGSNRAGSGSGTVDSRITDDGIVLVSIQYRLGALGFLSHPTLSAEQGGRSGNYGLMDQQAALGWVRRNIAAFGGDPARVTIAGESAGAQDVGLHLLSPGSRGLFARAIAESGTAGFGLPPRSLAQNEALGTLIGRQAGLTAQTPAALRALSVAQVLKADTDVNVPNLDDDSFIWLQAVVDGRVLTEAPASALAHGQFARVPLLIGVNARELTLHGGRPAAAATVRREFGANATAALALYGLQPGGTPVDDPRLGDVTRQLATDLTFRCPAIAVANAFAARGVPVWHYQFDYGADVSHASELRYVFGETKPGEPPMRRYWSNFVRGGTPNGASLPVWPAYARGRAYMAFDQTGPVAKQNLRGAICALRAVP